MQPMSWKCFALIAVAMCSLAMAAPAPQSLDELSPVEATEGLISGVDRDKRTILGPEVGFGVKNAILGYVFGDESELDDRILSHVTRATPVLPPGTTDDTPDFKHDQVMLEIPDELFGNSFTMVTDISKIFGDLMMSTARRYANFVQYLKPLLGKALTVKGLYPPPPTTTEAFKLDDTEDTSSKSESNDV